jgi:N-acyl homoserine lactone hydrolase
MVACEFGQFPYACVDLKLNVMKPAALHFLLAGACFLGGCAATSPPTHPVQPGAARSGKDLEAVLDQPGPLSVETVTAATWEVDRSGVLNLDDPKAKAAQLEDGPEPIGLYVHVIRHPQRGTFYVDSGVERAFTQDPDHALVHGLLGSAAHVDKLRTQIDTASLLARTGPIAGVFLTHLHSDHVLGLRDLPDQTPIYVGPGDAAAKSPMNLLMRGLFDAALAHKGALQEIGFSPDPSGQFAGVRDVFDDGSLWALWLPGHPPGTIAFVARTPQGPVLLTGDVCHTAWGWQHGVAPGKFSEDPKQSADAFARLQRFAQAHPQLDVRLGHQQLR